MAIPFTQQVTAKIAPSALTDIYATHDEIFGLGGWRSVVDNTERDAIFVPRRKFGMAVYVQTTGLTWILDSDLVSWVQYAAGGIPPADVMRISVYDPNADNIVTNSNQLGGSTLAQVKDRSTDTGVQAQSTITNLVADLALKEDKSNKGIANGYVPLNAGVKIDATYLTLPSPLNYINSWNATTNIPALADGIGTAGDSYIVGTAGTQDLGSGAIVFAIGDLVIYNAVAVWQKITPTPGGVSSVNALTGAVSLTTNTVPVFADKNYVTDDVEDALNGANSPSATNTFVTESDILSLIVVGNGYFQPELFNDGHTLGDGTKRVLNTLNAVSTGVPYTNASAGNYWTRVDSAYIIDVTVMDIDWIAWQEACLAMLQNGFANITNPGGRGYCPYNTIFLPTDQAAVVAARRSQIFNFDFCASTFNNVTGVSFPMFSKYPVNQADANGFRLDYEFHFSRARFYGNNSASENDCFIKIGGTNCSTFDKIHGSEMGMLIDAQFCLQVGFSHIRVDNYGKYGIAVRDGLWSGAGANTAQTNNADIFKVRAYSGTGKTATAAIYSQGNRNVNILSSVFEGDSGSVHHILYDQAYPPSGTLAGTVKNVLYMESLDFENAGASRAGIRIMGNNVYTELNRYNSQVSPAVMVALVEAYAINGINGGQSLYIHGANNYNPGYKFRQITSGGPTHKWEVERVDLNNNASLVNAANWDTAFAGSSLPITYTYRPIL